MKRYVLLFFLFLCLSSFGGVPEDNIIKVRIIIGGIEYISYVVLGENISIIRGEL